MTEDDPRHGTPAGYPAHRRAGTTACGPCREVYNERTRQAKRQRAKRSDPCVSCTLPTVSKDRVCRACRHREEIAAREVSDDFALTGGQWVPRDGIMRWEAA